MAGHGFKALQTFRGWSKENNEWMYGCLIEIHIPKNRTYISNDKFERICVKESIGIYTGKDDSTKWEDRPDWLKHIPKEYWTGVPIFAVLPEDGNIGGDMLEAQLYGISKGKVWSGCPYLKKDEMQFWLKFKDVELPYQHHILRDMVVIGTQYEQHLKEKKNV